MSIEGFVASQERRRAQICAEIERLTAMNDGVLPKKSDAKVTARKSQDRRCDLQSVAQRPDGVQRVSFRTYERLPASEFARRYHITTNKLRAEIAMPEPERTFIEPPGKYSGVWLIGALVFGASSWLALGWIALR